MHAIIVLKNGLTKLIYHETSMMIPLVNAIYDGRINISDFKDLKRKYMDQYPQKFTFKKVNKKVFPTVKLQSLANLYPSSPIIINASNEILVDHFLTKKIPFLGIFKIIMTILDNRNYKKYAIRKPKNLKQISLIDTWARKLTLEKIKLKYG